MPLFDSQSEEAILAKHTADTVVTGSDNPLTDDEDEYEIDDQHDETGAVLQKWEAIEHAGIGNVVFDEFIRAAGGNLYENWKEAKIYDPVTLDLRISDKIYLSAGQIVALAGDFYGIPEAPICRGGEDITNPEDTKQRRFKNAFRTLMRLDQAKGLETKLNGISDEAKRQEIINAALTELYKLTKEIDGEYNKIYAGVGNKVLPSDTSHAHANTTNFNYHMHTCNSRFGLFSSRFKDLAVTNYDHFGEDALAVYQAGHDLALKKARKAALETDPEKRDKGLLKAFLYVLFAAHFLTDQFATGHIRTPRKAIYDYVHAKWAYYLVDQLPFTDGLLAGALAKAMHDEDNAGLELENADGTKRWPGFGDHCYFNPANDKNAGFVQKTLKNVLETVYRVYQESLGSQASDNKVSAQVPEQSSKKCDDYEYKLYLPRVSSTETKQPLFKIDEKTNKLVVRRNLTNPECSNDDYVEDWDPMTIYLRFYAENKIQQGKERFGDLVLKLLHLKLLPEQKMILTDEEQRYVYKMLHEMKGSQVSAESVSSESGARVESHIHTPSC